MVVPPAQYVVEFSPTAYVWEPIPEEELVYPVGITAAAQCLPDNKFAHAMKFYRDQSGTHTALKNQLYQKYNPEFWTGVVQPGTGIATLSLLDMYAHLYASYGQITEGDMEEARSDITADFEFTTLPLEQYIFKVRKCQQPYGNALPPQPIIDTDAI